MNRDGQDEQNGNQIQFWQSDFLPRKALNTRKNTKGNFYIEIILTIL